MAPGVPILAGGVRVAGRLQGHHRGMNAWTVVLMLTAAPSVAAETSPEASDRGWILQSDIVTRVAPEGAMLFAGAVYRWSLDERPPPTALRHLQVGLTGGVNPAYAQVGTHVEVAPGPFLVLRADYDLLTYFGGFGSLLAFERPTDFSPSALADRAGEERAGLGHRFSAQAILRAKLGPVIVRHRTALRHYRFTEGPIVYEWEFDSLVGERDLLIDTETAVLAERISKRRTGRPGRPTACLASDSIVICIERSKP